VSPRDAITEAPTYRRHYFVGQAQRLHAGMLISLFFAACAHRRARSDSRNDCIKSCQFWDVTRSVDPFRAPNVWSRTGSASVEPRSFHSGNTAFVQFQAQPPDVGCLLHLRGASCDVCLHRNKIKPQPRGGSNARIDRHRSNRLRSTKTKSMRRDV
jgi:hypothetical protein